MNQPRISVVIPVWNGAQYLRQALESVLAQTYPAAEILVIDDGSTDSSPSIVESFGTVCRLVRQPHSGLARSRNHGIEISTGDLIAFFSHDDIWDRKKLEEQCAVLNDHPDVQYVISHFEYFLDADASVPENFRKELLDRALVGRIPETLIARRELFKRIGVFSTEYKSIEDFDWFLRARDAGIPEATLPQVHLRKRIHGTNMSLLTQGVSTELLEAVRQSLQRKRYNTIPKEQRA